MRADVTQQHRERHEGDRGPEQGEVGDRADRLGAPDEVAPVLRQSRHRQQEQAADQHGPPVQHHRVERARAPLLRDAAHRRAERGERERGRAERRFVGRPELDALEERERQPGDPDQHPHQQRGPERLVVQQHAAEQRRVERQDPEQHRGEPGRHVLLAPVDEPVGERERREREHGRERPVRAQRPPLDRPRRPAAASPASVNRTPAPSSGGQSSRPILIATQVLDQIRTSSP